jgi:flagellar hook-associated protein 3 FlgL
MAIIRTTHATLFNIMSRQGSKLKNEIRKWEEQAITGLKVNRPSDAPGKISQINRLRETVADQSVYVDNAVSSQTWLGAMDQVLGEAEDVLVRAREIATQMANGTYNSEDLQAAVVEVEGLQDAFLQHANTDIGGRYLFAGSGYNDPPFADTSGTYTGGTGTPSTLIGNGVYVDTALVGSDLFTEGFAALQELSNALASGDTEQVADTLNTIEDARTTVLRSWQQVGYTYSLTEDAIQAAEGLELILTESLNKLVTADLEEAYTRLVETRTSYEAALQVASSGFDLSLFNYI